LAGFFDHGDDKLIEPVLVPVGDRPQPPPRQAEGNEAAAPVTQPHGADRTVTLPVAADHPSIMGLLMALPEPGKTWDAEGRVKWLRAAVAAFDLIYKGAGPEIMVTQV